MVGESQRQATAIGAQRGDLGNVGKLCAAAQALETELPAFCIDLVVDAISFFLRGEREGHGAIL